MTRWCRSCALPESRRQRSLDLDGVAREVRCRSGRPDSVDQALAVQEAERQLLVVARGPHRDDQGRAVDADLERILDRDLIIDAVVFDRRVHVKANRTLGAGLAGVPGG